MKAKHFFKTLTLYVVIPLCIGVASGVLVLVYQNVSNFKNVLFFLAQELKQNQETLFIFSAKETLEIPLSDSQVPNKYWNTLDASALNNIYNCDDNRSIEVFYTSLDILKSNYTLFLSIILNGQKNLEKFAADVNEQELSTLELNRRARASLDGCDRSFFQLFLHELKNVLVPTPWQT